MCGIAGIIGNYEKRAITRMLEATLHRGPDHSGTFFDNDVVMGMNRLSIVDLSVHANQPIYSSDGRYIIVYNGEVYNFKEIRIELEKKGVVFQSNSDTEVVLYAFIHYGKLMLDKIRGMFAFAIWDKQKKKLFAARDHLGIKPFLFSHKNARFIFCSELKGMLASGYFRNSPLDVNSINTFLTLGHTISPFTMIEGIQSLKSGHYLEFENDKLTIEQYWFPEKISSIKSGDISYDECLRIIRELVMNSVNEELVSDVPLGVFLSGGLDSTVITAAMKLSGNNNIHSYTVGFQKKNSAFDETSISEKSAKFFKTNHTTLRIQESEIENIFNDFITGLDQPSRDGLNTFLVSKHVCKNVKVALSGLGGDELFIGYNGYFKYLLNTKSPSLGSLYNFLNLPLIRNIVPNKVNRRAFSYHASNDEILYYTFSLQKHIELFGNNYLNHEIESGNIYKRTAEIIRDNYKSGLNQINQIRMLYINQHMGNMLLRDSDSVAMKNSLEVRFPLIDKRLVELALSMPAEYLIKDLSIAGNRNYEKSGLKRMLSDAFINELPPDVMNQTKRGFQLPTAVWLKSSLKPFLEDSIYNSSDLFSRRELSLLYNNGNYPDSHFKILYSILIFDQWYKQVYQIK